MKAEIKQEAQGWRIEIDGKPLATPKRAPLYLPAQTLAEAVAEEWRGGKKFSPSAMPFTAMAFTAVDVVAAQQERMVEAMLAFADTDLLLYRSETPKLRARQDAAWNPVLAWVERAFGAAPRITEGVMPIEQPEEMLAAMRAALTKMDAFTMAAFSVLTQNLGSLFLALAVKKGYLEAEQAFAHSRIDEDYQAEEWGEDSLALARGREIQRDVLAAARFLACL